MKLLLVDTETGGLDASKHSIISVGMVVWEDGVLGDTLHLTIREPEGFYNDEALKVSGFTMDRINRGCSPKQATWAIREFMRKNNVLWNTDLGGHNLAFDVAFLKRLYSLAGVRYSFGHRGLDTLPVAVFLKACGILKVDSCSLDNLCAHYGIKIREEGAPHDALQDIIATGKLLTKLIEEVKRGPEGPVAGVPA